MRDMYLLLSESSIGVHYSKSTPQEKFEIFPLTFPINITKSEDGFEYLASLSKNDVFKTLVRRYFLYKESFGSVSVLVGFDFDRMGELMSDAVKESLLHHGIDEKDIFRTPLTEGGYIANKPFVEYSFIKTILYYQQTYMKKIKSVVIKNVGFVKALAMKYAILHKGRSFNIGDSKRVNKNGNSTVTVISKIIGERNG